MKINTSLNIQQRESLRGMFLNPRAALNRSVLLGGKSVRRDTLSISGTGKANSLVEGLREQKENIKKQRESLIATTLENGGSKDDIEAALDAYDIQLENIEGEIDRLLAEQAQRQVKQLTLKNKEDPPKTGLEAQNQHMARVANLSRDLDRARAVDSVKQKVDGKIPVLKSEIERDQGLHFQMVERSDTLEPKDLSNHSITSKEARLRELEQLSDELAADVGGKLADIVKQLEDAGHQNQVRQEEGGPVEDEATGGPAAPAETAPDASGAPASDE